ncbi:hypothetical protein BD311DRAFT_676667 [Dichomitus squalens]|uniref:Uncharacterized protein n=1 Tax=Dichomitus squalens TaxID=114155 RepID=A0A4Q9M768_9APHY|nr:hypothetical protein BD311DRAFT_676667 [Dichomitus squalens]
MSSLCLICRGAPSRAEQHNCLRENIDPRRERYITATSHPVNSTRKSRHLVTYAMRSSSSVRVVTTVESTSSLESVCYHATMVHFAELRPDIQS